MLLAVFHDALQGTLLFFVRYPRRNGDFYNSFLNLRRSQTEAGSGRSIELRSRIHIALPNVPTT